MEEVFQRLIDRNLLDLAGLRAEASIPLSQFLINELVEAALVGEETIRSCRVDIHEQNRVSVRLKTSMLPWTLALKLKLDTAVDFASFSSPKVRLWLENNRLLGSLGSFFNALPGWAKLYGDQVVVDLDYFLHTPEQKKLFALLKSVGISTEDGKAIFDIQLEVG